MKQFSPIRLCTDRFPPNLKGLCPQDPIAHRRHEMSPLSEVINDFSVLVDSLPNIVAFAFYRNQPLVDMPGIAQTALPFLEFTGVGRPKLLAPLANRFIGDGDTSFGKEFFDFTETETEPMIQPNSVVNNFGRKTMTLIANGFGLHTGQSAKRELN